MGYNVNIDIDIYIQDISSVMDYDTRFVSLSNSVQCFGSMNYLIFYV